MLCRISRQNFPINLLFHFSIPYFSFLSNYFLHRERTFFLRWFRRFLTESTNNSNCCAISEITWNSYRRSNCIINIRIEFCRQNFPIHVLHLLRTLHVIQFFSSCLYAFRWTQTFYRSPGNLDEQSTRYGNCSYHVES